MRKAGGKGAKTAAEREAEARREKLEHVQEQISSGSLVIRSMTAAERAKWAKRRAVSADAATPAERKSRAAAVENRQRRRRTSS
jgi:hypothetical protein